MEVIKSKNNPITKNVREDTLNLERFLFRFLKLIDPDLTYKDWIIIGRVLKNQLGPTGFYVWDDWSARGRKYPEKGGGAPGTENLREIWDLFENSKTPTLASLFNISRKYNKRKPIQLTIN